MKDEVKLLVQLRCSCVVFRDEQVLLVRHIRGDRTYWVLPGGRPLEGEVATAAVEREILEEAGIQVQAQKVLFVWEGIPSDEMPRTLELVFQAELADHDREPRSSNPDEEPRFVPIDDIGGLELYPAVAGYLRGSWGQRLRRARRTSGTCGAP